jgi:hypothetical protein
MKTPLQFKKDSGQSPQYLLGKGYQITALSGRFNGSYGLLLEGDIQGQPAKWFFPRKEELTRGDLHHLHQGLKDPVFREQFLQPDIPESLYPTVYLRNLANKHFNGVTVISAGGNQDYPAIWSTLTVIGLDSEANASSIKAIKGLKGLRLGKHKGQTYLMPNLEDCHPHPANAAFLDWLSQDDLILAKDILRLPNALDSIYPKLKRPASVPTKDSVKSNPLQEEIEAIRHMHPETVDVRLNKLKSGQDEFSRMKADDLKTKLGAEDLEQIERRFKQDSLRLNAMRWAARGLPAALAIRKVVMLQEDRDFFTSAHRSGQALYEP